MWSWQCKLFFVFLQHLRLIEDQIMEHIAWQNVILNYFAIVFLYLWLLNLVNYTMIQWNCDFFHCCKNFVCRQPVFMILQEICNKNMYRVFPPNMVCVTTLPCKNLITTLVVFTDIYIAVSKKLLSLLWHCLCQFSPNSVIFEMNVTDECC